MNSKSLAILFFTLVLVMVSSMCQGSYIKSNTFKIDFTNSKEARKKALWFPADKLNVTKQGLGWDAEAAALRPGEIQTKPIALGHSWRTPPSINVRVTILPPPKTILLNDGNMSSPYLGNVFVRYSPDLKNWSSWIILEHSYRKYSDKKKRNERCYEGRISVTQRNRNEYYKLLHNYSKLDVPWKSDEEAAVRWIIKQQPKFFSKNIPFIGYVEFLFESNFYGGQRIKSFKADVSYGMGGKQYYPPNTGTINKRSAIPWRFKAKQNDNPDKATTTIADNMNRPNPNDIKEFVADPIPRLSSSYFKNFKITQKDIENILKNYHTIDEEHWRNGYSHVAGGDRTGHLILKNGKKIEWVVRPGGLATLKLPNGKMIYLAKELTPWKKKAKQKDAIDKTKQLSLTIIKPFNENLFAKGTGFKIPTKLRNGTANQSDVEKWTKHLRGMEPVIQKDFNADDVPDLLAEIVYARGATGNRSFMLFVHTGLGYKYLRCISNIGNYMTYDESGKSYLLTHSNAGGSEVHISLCQLTESKLIQVGKPLVLLTGDGGTKEGNRLYNRLFYRIILENKLIKIFKKSNKIDALDTHSSHKVIKSLGAE